jgi:hypothetical protein
MGFRALRRLRKRAATNTGFASPGCAASPGFLGLLTRYSARNPSRLVSCGKRPWASAFRGFPFPVARCPLQDPMSFVPFAVAPPVPASRFARYVAAAPRIYAPGKSVSAGRCYPVIADRSSPSVAPLRGFHPSGLGPVLPRCLLSWASTSRWTASRPSRRPLCRVSKNRRFGWPLSRTADLPEVSVIRRRIRERNPDF